MLREREHDGVPSVGRGADMSRRSKIVLIATGAAVAVLALAVACWIVANSRDISPPDTSDLFLTLPIARRG